MRMESFRRHALVIGMLALLAVGAGAQLQTGNLFGTVTDEQGEPLPGISLTLTGVGAPRIQISNAAGQYRFLSLPPGSYELTAELEGFSTVEFPDVEIRVGRNTTVNVTMTPAIEEEITVSSESPLLDERKLGPGTTVTQVELDKVPTARDPWALLNQAPGVRTDRVNVGGNESGLQSLFVGPGSHSNDNVYAVDGVVITDMTAIGASPAYYDFDALTEVQLSTGGTDVALATGGVTVNLVTRRGTDEWRGSARYLATDSGSQSSSGFRRGDLGPGLAYQLPGTAAPGSVPAQTGLVANRIDDFSEVGGEAGGDVIRDRLWVWGAYAEQHITNRALGGDPDSTVLENYNAKLDASLSSANSAVLQYSQSDKIKVGRDAGPDRPPETTWNQNGPVDVWKLEDSHVFSSDFFLTGLWSQVDGGLQLFPQGGLDRQVLLDAGGIWRRTFGALRSDRDSEQWRLDGSYFFNAGGASHELRFGTSFREAGNATGTRWGSGAIVIEDQGPGGLNFAQVFRGDIPGSSLETEYQGVWLQDTIARDRLTLNLGLRYDVQDGRNHPFTVAGSSLLPDLLPDLEFDGNDAQGLEFESLSPRLGVTYALGSDRRTLLRGSYSRFAQQLQHALVRRVNPLDTAFAFIAFFDLDGDLEFSPAEPFIFLAPEGFDPADPTALSSPNLNDPGLGPELTDEINLGVEHALRPELVVGALVTWRNVSDLHERAYLVRDAPGAAPRPAGPADFVPADPVVGVLPSGDPIAVPTFVLVPELTGGRLLRNGDREEDYLGLSLTVTKRLADRWMLRGNFTASDWEWDIPSSYFYDANDLAPGDRPETAVDNDHDFDDDGAVVTERSGEKTDVLIHSGWSFNVNGMVQVAPDRPWGFDVAANVSGREGYPLPYYLNNVPGADGILRDLQVTGTDAIRADDLYTLDLHLDKELSIAGDFAVTLSVDAFNLLNEGTVLQRERNLPRAAARVDTDSGSPFFGRTVTQLVGSTRADYVNEVLSPRVFRFGVRLSWK